MITILAFPLEVLWQVFTVILPDAQTVRICRLVCRYFAKSIESCLVLQIHLKCSAWGYREPLLELEGTSLTMSDYLTRLDAHVRSWRNLDWHELRIRIPPLGGAYALVSLALIYHPSSAINFPRGS